MGPGVERGEIACKRGIGSNEVGGGRRGRLPVGAVIVLREQSDVALRYGLPERNGPGGFVACIGWAGDGDVWLYSEDGGSILVPEGEELRKGPIAVEVTARVAVEVAFVADFDAEKRGTELLKCVIDFGCCQVGAGGACGGAAEVNAVKALPSGGFDEGGQGGEVGWGDLACGVPEAGGAPDVFVDGVAADAEDAGADALEEGDQIGVGGSEEPGALVDGAFLVGEPGEGWADGTDDCGRYRERCGG